MIIGSSETIPKNETNKKKQLFTFVHNFLHIEDVLNELKGYNRARRTSANTRYNRTKTEIHEIGLEAARKSKCYQGAIIFNELPTKMRKKMSLTLSKKLI